MLRLPNWSHQLDRLCQQRLHMPFAWGPNDCAAFAADAVLAMRGHDSLHGLRLPRTSARAAGRAKGAIGGFHAALRRAGLQEVAPALAQRGDLVLLHQPAHGRRMRSLLAVCMGAWAVAPSTHGLASVPMNQAVAAWRV
jgi:hypothetical protein